MGQERGVARGLHARKASAMALKQQIQKSRAARGTRSSRRWQAEAGSRRLNADERPTRKRNQCLSHVSIAGGRPQCSR